MQWTNAKLGASPGWLNDETRTDVQMLNNDWGSLSWSSPARYTSCLFLWCSYWNGSPKEMWFHWGNEPQIQVFLFNKQPCRKRRVGLFTSGLNTKPDDANMLWQCCIKSENKSLGMLPQRFSHGADTQQNDVRKTFEPLFRSEHWLKLPLFYLQIICCVWHGKVDRTLSVMVCFHCSLDQFETWVGQLHFLSKWLKHRQLESAAFDIEVPFEN